jgi:glycosyltransferase involved in cell wall biosynthesis
MTIQDMEIAYILKGYPRNSEAFILNEIYLLEQLGLKLRLFPVKKEKEKKAHHLVGRIQAAVTYLPEVESVSDSDFGGWLAANLPKFWASHWRLLRLRPGAYLGTLRNAVHLSLKYRRDFLSKPKRVFYKDFLRAGYIALQVLENDRIQHLHGHFCHGSTTITMFVSQMTGIPYSFTAHAKDIYLPDLNPGDLLPLKIRRAEFVVTCTDANRLHLQQRCADGAPIHTIYHGLDTSLFAPLPARNEGQPLILSVGRFVAKKGFTFLVEACRLLKAQGLDFQCRIVGEAGEELEAVRKLIKDLQLEDTVLIHNAVTQEELRHIYQDCTVFALPCQIINDGDRDGIPNVLAEAMAMGKAVVSTDISGIPELVDDGLNGLLAPQKDAAALARALKTLLQNPELRQKLGAAARLKINCMFDAQETTLALRDLFTAALARRRAGRLAQTLRVSETLRVWSR